jgi:hypothetical protein
MRRALSYILVFAAMIFQIGMGALPASETCLCVPVVTPAPDCCCADIEDCGTPSDRVCPCHDGCKRCICVPRPDERAALSARSHLPKFGDEGNAAAMPLGFPESAWSCVRLATRAAPRATESPPHLAPLRTVHLNL